MAGFGSPAGVGLFVLSGKRSLTCSVIPAGDTQSLPRCTLVSKGTPWEVLGASRGARVGPPPGRALVTLHPRLEQHLAQLMAIL